MDCVSERIYAIFVDGELAAEEARQVQNHLATCLRCRQLVDALRAENRILNEVLGELPEEAVGAAGLPWFRRRPVWGDLAAVAAVLALGVAASQWINEQQIPKVLDWFNPFSFAGRMNLITNLSYYLGQGGTAMLAHYADTVGWLSLLLFLLGSGGLLLGRRWRRHQPGSRVLIVFLALSLPGFALERRHSEFVTVAANETVDDTLVAAGNTVRVEGVVNGDLLAFGRIVEVRGTVKGDLLSWAQRTEVSGTVEGHIYTFSQTLDVSGQAGRSIYAWVQSLRTDNKSHVGDGVVAGAADISLDGEVTRSVSIFAGNADVSGSIGRDLALTGGSLTLTNSARIGGNLSAAVHRRDDVHIAEGATIGGKRDIKVHTEKSRRFVQPKFYFFQAVWLLAAMLVGWLGLVLFPGFIQGSAQAVGAGWRSFGLGLAVLVGTPMAVIVGAVTLVGSPVALMLLALYVAAIYLAKVWVGAFLGGVLLKSARATTRDWLLSLLLGLLIITVVGFIPYVGGLVRFGVVCLGLGAFAWQLYQVSQRLRLAT